MIPYFTFRFEKEIKDFSQVTFRSVTTLFSFSFTGDVTVLPARTSPDEATEAGIRQRNRLGNPDPAKRRDWELRLEHDLSQTWSGRFEGSMGRLFDALRKQKWNDINLFEYCAAFMRIDINEKFNISFGINGEDFIKQQILGRIEFQFQAIDQSIEVSDARLRFVGNVRVIVKFKAAFISTFLVRFYARFLQTTHLRVSTAVFSMARVWLIRYQIATAECIATTRTTVGIVIESVETRALSTATTIGQRVAPVVTVLGNIAGSLSTPLLFIIPVDRSEHPEA